MANAKSASINQKLVKSAVYINANGYLNLEEIKAALHAYDVIVTKSTSSAFKNNVETVQEALRMLDLAMPERLITIWLEHSAAQ